MQFTEHTLLSHKALSGFHDCLYTLDTFIHSHYMANVVTHPAGLDRLVKTTLIGCSGLRDGTILCDVPDISGIKGVITQEKVCSLLYQCDIGIPF